tara:strand:- start:31 stop:378 length:348 start_codon:yes stop_codon:yes gene_type:complete
MPHQGRYENRGIVSLEKGDMFKQIKKMRNRDSIRILATAQFNRLSEEDLDDIEYDSYIWTRGDRFYKLAFDFYSEPEYWWIIALFNNAPTEQHLSIGEEIFIPKNPEFVAEILGV